MAGVEQCSKAGPMGIKGGKNILERVHINGKRGLNRGDINY